MDAAELDRVLADDYVGDVTALAMDDLRSKRAECQECVKIGGDWVHLRTCQECGGTHCCDDSRNRHATRHARETSHPVIASAEADERWLYCYPHDTVAMY